MLTVSTEDGNEQSKSNEQEIDEVVCNQYTYFSLRTILYQFTFLLINNSNMFVVKKVANYPKKDQRHMYKRRCQPCFNFYLSATTRFGCTAILETKPRTTLSASYRNTMPSARRFAADSRTKSSRKSLSMFLLSSPAKVHGMFSLHYMLNFFILKERLVTKIVFKSVNG